MTLKFKHLNFHKPSLKMLEPKMEVNGKRATAYLYFQITAGEEVVGDGFKKLAVSGLRDYEAEPMEAFVEEYLARKHGYLGNLDVVSA
jgi:hypothetical protein